MKVFAVRLGQQLIVCSACDHSAAQLRDSLGIQNAAQSTRSENIAVRADNGIREVTCNPMSRALSKAPS